MHRVARFSNSNNNIIIIIHIFIKRHMAITSEALQFVNGNGIATQTH